MGCPSREGLSEAAGQEGQVIGYVLFGVLVLNGCILVLIGWSVWRDNQP